MSLSFYYIRYDIYNVFLTKVEKNTNRDKYSNSINKYFKATLSFFHARTKIITWFPLITDYINFEFTIARLMTCFYVKIVFYQRKSKIVKPHVSALCFTVPFASNYCICLYNHPWHYPSWNEDNYLQIYWSLFLNTFHRVRKSWFVALLVLEIKVRSHFRVIWFTFVILSTFLWWYYLNDNFETFC